MFLIYWQFSGYLNYLFSNVPWPSKATQNLQTQKSIKRTLIAFGVSMAFYLQTFALLGYFVATENHAILLTDIRVLDVSNWVNPSMSIALGVVRPLYNLANQRRKKDDSTT